LVERTVEPCLDPDDTDGDLDAMTNVDLRRHIDELKASRDRRPAVVARLFKAIGVLKHREGLSRPPRLLRSDPVAVAPVPTPPRDARTRGRVRFATVLGRVDREAGPKQIEDLARRLAEDLADERSFSTFRRIAEWVRSGEVRPKVVARAYALAKRPGVNRPAALFTWYVFDRSPQAARARAARR
jgi:hypothetical protein